MSQYNKFVELYERDKENRQYNLIPTKQTYDNILKYLLTKEADNSVPGATLANWRHRWGNLNYKFKYIWKFQGIQSESVKTKRFFTVEESELFGRRKFLM